MVRGAIARLPAAALLLARTLHVLAATITSLALVISDLIRQTVEVALTCCTSLFLLLLINRFLVAHVGYVLSIPLVTAAQHTPSTPQRRWTMASSGTSWR